MKKIDRETVQRILDTADIVDVVSDFVSLKRRGANYIGLCPFHNERTPSFSVSKAKGICKCFSCGKGGSPVNFIMEHEQMSYYEALRYLAKKYNIEIRERELTDKEREEASERESLSAINDFALSHFEHTLKNTDDGRDIGLAYFRERGISDKMIERFRLGYALESPADDLYKAAVSKGFSEKYLLATGLSAKSERGQVYDKFRGRVIYPIFSVSGRVVGFGARTLRKDKNVAKYMNSPESAIYRKSYELYGLYQAKGAIAKNDKCLLVEGYMDVISMYQAGVENVVASSGTSLTEGQIRLIHRFTKNVTVIYDSDAAGIKASLRGIDMLLREGLDIKVLLLPDGDDPDSFAQSHTSAEVMEYIAAHETDFISFKTDILLKDAANDPIARARVINDIIRSISLIPDAVARAVYLAECSRRLDIDEKVLALQTSKVMGENMEQEQKRAQQQQAREASQAVVPAAAPQPAQAPAHPVNEKLRRHERMLAKYMVKYGLVPIAEALTEEGAAPQSFTVLDFIASELAADEIGWTDPVVARIMDIGMDVESTQWDDAWQKFQVDLAARLEAEANEGREEVRRQATSLADIEKGELMLKERIEARRIEETDNFIIRYLEDIYLSWPEDDVRVLATDLAAEKYQLSKVHTKYAKIETERDRLQELVQRAVSELKLAVLDQNIATLNMEIKHAKDDPERSKELMRQLFDLYQIKSQFAKFLGDRIVNPK